jgi:hypothetical protein
LSEIEKLEYESPAVSVGAAIAALKALEDLKNRSFSARHPELGRMIKCQVCGLRHRDSIKCEQKFVELWVEEDLETGEKKTVFAVAQQPEGAEIRHQISAQQPTLKQMVGAAQFKGKRQKPHPNKRVLQFIELVRTLLPDEYTEEDMTRARKKATRILIKKHGRFNFLPRKSAPQPKKEKSVG